MKRTIVMLTALIMMLTVAGTALGDIRLEKDTEAMLPDGEHLITLPAGMLSQTPDPEETALKGIFQREPDLEMLVFAYLREGKTVDDMAQDLAAAGRDAQVREIGGERFLVSQDQDEADGAYYVGYSYIYGDWVIEIAFFYSSQEAADLTKTIMESFH